MAHDYGKWDEVKKTQVSQKVVPSGRAQCIAAERFDANRVARDINAKLRVGEHPTRRQALEVLRRWGFTRNRARKNVRPQKKQWVYSDTLGLMPYRGQPGWTQASDSHQEVFKLLAGWVQAELGGNQHIKYTTMSINYGYAARRHRDSNNEGISAVAACGQFEGGKLRIWKKIAEGKKSAT